MLFLTLGSSSLPVVVAQPDERHANRTASCWSGMTDTEHSTTSGSYKEAWFIRGRDKQQDSTGKKLCYNSNAGDGVLIKDVHS